MRTLYKWSSGLAVAVLLLSSPSFSQTQSATSSHVAKPSNGKKGGKTDPCVGCRPEQRESSGIAVSARHRRGDREENHRWPALLFGSRSFESRHSRETNSGLFVDGEGRLCARGSCCLAHLFQPTCSAAFEGVENFR